MAFDGITVASLCAELQSKLTGGKIAKIIQPENDALLMTIKSRGETHRLLLSANASLPLLYLTDENRSAPDTAPNFCMLLRKHIGGGAIESITQPGLERIIRVNVLHRDELGDLVTRTLVIELMGKYSNIILLDQTETVLDSIKRIPAHISSVREVLPGRPYFVPQTRNKKDPETISEDDFTEAIRKSRAPIAKALYTTLTGISPVIAEELCMRASIPATDAADALSNAACFHLYHTLRQLMEEIKQKDFTPIIYYDGSVPAEFSAVPLTGFTNAHAREFDSPSELLRTYYAEKERQTRIRQRSTDLRKLVATLTEREVKKLSLQERQLKDTEGREKYRVRGELINAYGYGLTEGERVLEAVNYYTGETVKIPIDPTKTVSENAQHNFARYTKLKRTAEDLEKRIISTRETAEHLESIRTSLDLAETEEDLLQIREELERSGYVRAKHTGKKKKQAITASPLHFLSSSGYDIYVGKNNLQNEEVTFQIASPDDWWFHAKKMPGSHVIVKGHGKEELPDSVFEEAGRLAAYYSKGRTAPKVEIDYTLRRNLKKPTGSNPGFVIYHTNYSLMASPDLTGIREAADE
jgi:predicted ribosome quality control (RQC) complex YloA/Tae2 family protein